MMMVNGVVTLMNAKLLDMITMVVLKLCNVMEQLLISNTNATTKTKILLYATIMLLIDTEIMMQADISMQADLIWISAKMAGMIDFFRISSECYITRKYPLRGYILGVLTHTTTLDQLWGGDGTLTMWF